MFYKRHTKVFEYDCDANARLKLSGAMKYMQETSAEHLNSIGLPFEKLCRENMVFLLSKSCVRVHDMPKAGQPIVLGTAAVQPRGARFLREFVIETPDGTRLLSALTLWVLVEPETRRILRPKSFPYPLPFQETAFSGDVEDYSLPPPLSGELAFHTQSLTVSYSHIDSNNHVTNSAYGDMVCDMLPYGRLLRGGIDTFVICFESEARWGERLELQSFAQSETRYIVEGRHSGGYCFRSFVCLSGQESG